MTTAAGRGEGAQQSVAIEVLGCRYRIRTGADAASIARVAELVSATVDRIRDRTGTADSLDLIVMAALNLANDLLATRADRERLEMEQIAPERVRALCDEVQSVLSDAGCPDP